jgi:hypothetical protein
MTKVMLAPLFSAVQPKGGSMKKVLASVVIVAFFTTGCTGSFNLVHKVYNFHRSQADKWTDEICFLLVALLPVYSLATLADAIIFNSIEFWTGKNPVELSAMPGGNRMAYNSKTGQVQVAVPKIDWLIFERSSIGVVAKNDKGQVMYSSVQGTNGDVAIYNAQGKLVKNYPAGQIALLKEKYIQQ